MEINSLWNVVTKMLIFINSRCYGAGGLFGEPKPCRTCCGRKTYERRWTIVPRKYQYAEDGRRLHYGDVGRPCYYPHRNRYLKTVTTVSPEKQVKMCASFPQGWWCFIVLKHVLFGKCNLFVGSCTLATDKFFREIIGCWVQVKVQNGVIRVATLVILLSPELKKSTRDFKLNRLKFNSVYTSLEFIWASSWDYGTYHIGDQWRLGRACAFAQSRQSLRCSHTWSMEVDEGSDQKSVI